MFVFWALFHVLNVTIEMRHTPFIGWIRDMSAADHYHDLQPVRPDAVGSALGSADWRHARHRLLADPVRPHHGWTAKPLGPPTDPMQRQIMRWIPLLFLFLFAGFASGLVIYYVWSNLISIAQQYIIMRRTGVETELDKWLAKRLKKKRPRNNRWAYSPRGSTGARPCRAARHEGYSATGRLALMVSSDRRKRPSNHEGGLTELATRMTDFTEDPD